MFRVWKQQKFVGGRILKTGIAVTITAAVCYMLSWPAMFAVITAIVTIEPTAKDSIRKAFVRFPASAIGAAYSVLFTFLLGDSPLSYTFVALGTIYTCYKLRLHAGILVATLTGVAMISTVHDEYVVSFLVRLGTTTIGLVVSSLVNLLVFRADYTTDIQSKMKKLLSDIGDVFERRVQEILNGQPLHRGTRAAFQSIRHSLESIETLGQYQKSEWRYHRFDREEARAFHFTFKKFAIMQQFVYQLGTMFALPTIRITDRDTSQAVLRLVALVRNLDEESADKADAYRMVNEQLLQRVHDIQSTSAGNRNEHGPGSLVPQETLYLFIWIAVLDLLEEWKQLEQREARYKERIALS